MVARIRSLMIGAIGGDSGPQPAAGAQKQTKIFLLGSGSDSCVLDDIEMAIFFCACDVSTSNVLDVLTGFQNQILAA